MSYHFTTDRLESPFYYSDTYITCAYIYTRGARGICGKPCFQTVYGNLCVCKTHKQIYKKERTDYQKIKRIETLQTTVAQLQREQSRPAGLPFGRPLGGSLESSGGSIFGLVHREPPLGIPPFGGQSPLGIHMFGGQPLGIHPFGGQSPLGGLGFGPRKPIEFDKIPSVIERSTECSVCYNTSELLSLPCEHVTCYSCYTKLPREECPVCREKIVHRFVKRI